MFSASRLEPVASITVPAFPDRQVESRVPGSPMYASVSRVTSLTAALAPTPTAPATWAAPAML